MKFIIIAALALVAVVSCAPAQPNDVQIIRSDIDQQPDGAYNFNLETSDGTARQETGELKEVRDEENKPQTVVVVRGTYKFVDDDGKTHVVNFIADENGYRAEGEDIPQVPARR